MEPSPWLDPRFLFAVAVQIIGFIIALTLLWSSTRDAHARIDDVEKEAEKNEAADKLNFKEIELAISENKTAFYKHLADVKAHHNEEAVQEFRTALERRFSGMEESLKDIARKLNHLANRE